MLSKLGTLLIQLIHTVFDLCETSPRKWSTTPAPPKRGAAFEKGDDAKRFVASYPNVGASQDVNLQTLG